MSQGGSAGFRGVVQGHLRQLLSQSASVEKKTSLKTRQDKTRQDQDKTGRSKTRQDKTGQDKTSLKTRQPLPKESVLEEDTTSRSRFKCQEKSLSSLIQTGESSSLDLIVGFYFVLLDFSTSSFFLNVRVWGERAFFRDCFRGP